MASFLMDREMRLESVSLLKPQCDVMSLMWRRGGVRTNNCKTEGMKVVIFEPQSKAFYKCASRRCYVTVVFRTYIRTILTSGRPCGWLRSAGWLAERLEMARERAKKREEGKFINPRCINDDETQYKTHRSSQPIREEEQSRLCERWSCRGQHCDLTAN